MAGGISGSTEGQAGTVSSQHTQQVYERSVSDIFCHTVDHLEVQQMT